MQINKPFKTNKMKKLFVTALTIAAMTTFSQAQELKSDAPQSAVKKEMTKAEKDAMKAKKEADLVEAFKRADLTEEQQKKAREAMEEASLKNKEVKADSKLSEEAKQAKTKENNDAKNEKLKEIMGDMKYKAFKQAQKAQKEMANLQAAPTKE